MTSAFLFLLISFTLATDPIRCVNFFGVETERKSPICDWANPPKYYLKYLKDAVGLNTVRIPYSKEYVNGKDFKKLDLLVDQAHELDLRVILDYHRSYASHQGAVPTEGFSLGAFIDTHLTVMERYKDKAFGVGVFNEIQINDAHYVNAINHATANAIESQFPNKFHYFLGCSTWGHDCRNITLPSGLENRSYIDIHQYAFTDKLSTRESMIPGPDYDKYFVGEIGAKQEDMPWLKDYFKFLKNKNITNMCYWTIAHSHDTGGLWKDDCKTVEEEKIDLLLDFWNVTTTTSQLPLCRPNLRNRFL